MSRFNDCLAFVLEWEGGLVEDRDDPGGRTNKGITQNTYDAWRKKQGVTHAAVDGISDLEVAAIYKNEYWDRIAAELKPPLDLAAFDTAVNVGVVRTMRWLGDCWKGDWRKAKTCLLEKRRAHYERLIARRPAMSKFRKGWMRRVDALALAE